MTGRTLNHGWKLRKRHWAVFAAAMWMTLAVMAPGASAAQTIGAIVTPSGSCNADDTIVQTTSPSNQYRAPSAGVITSWSYRSGPATGMLKLKVVRETGTAFEYTTVGDSALQTAAASQLNTYPTQISVQAGDIIGVYLQTDGLFCVLSPSPGYVADFYNGDAQGTQTYAPAFNGQLPISAILEPDCDGDGQGDETQDGDTSSCNPQPQPEPEPQPAPKADGTLTIDANKGKVEKGRKVTLTGQLDVASNESCEPGRSIQIQRRLKSEDDSKFATFQTVQTDATGNYSLKVKVKKTYFYRAVVAENDACDDETSSSQKVRVQKRKAAQEA